MSIITRTLTRQPVYNSSLLCAMYQMHLLHLYIYCFNVFLPFLLTFLHSLYTKFCIGAFNVIANPDQMEICGKQFKMRFCMCIPLVLDCVLSWWCKNGTVALLFYKAMCATMTTHMQNRHIGTFSVCVCVCAPQVILCNVILWIPTHCTYY